MAPMVWPMRVVRQIQKQHRPLQRTGVPEVLPEKLRLLKGDADGGKHHGEGFVFPPHLGLPGNLGGQLGVRQAGAGKDGQFLPPDQGVQPVDGGDAGLDKLRGIVPGGGVEGGAVDV